MILLTNYAYQSIEFIHFQILFLRNFVVFNLDQLYYAILFVF